MFTKFAKNYQKFASAIKKNTHKKIKNKIVLFTLH